MLVPYAFSAVTPNSAVAVQAPKSWPVQFLSGSDASNTYKTLVTGGTNGTKISAIYITSNDSVSHAVTCQYKSGSVYYGGFTVNTGTTLPGFANGVLSINGMASTVWAGLPVDAWGNPYDIINSGDSISCTWNTGSLTATDVINVVAVGGGDF